MPICAICGHQMDEACGFSSVWEDDDEYPLCHGDTHSCYWRYQFAGEDINFPDLSLET